MNTPLYLKIDLTNNTSSEYQIPEEYFKKYIGGKTLAAKLLLELTQSGINPLSPEATIIINTGPLNGTGAPSSSRFNMSFKSPQTNMIASSNCGGQFGVMLKKSGYDGLIITGKAQTPIIIDITDKTLNIKDATELWGLDTEQTQEKLPSHYGKLVIGPAGENMVLYAATASGERMAGRCGSGAVLGSKNIKGIIAYGTQKPKVEHPDKYYKFIKKWVRFIKKHPMTGESLPHYGSAGLVSKANATHALPTRNFQKGFFENADSVSGETLSEKYLVRNSGCISCPIRCERRVNVDNKEVKGPEYETLGFFGPNIDSDDMPTILKLNYLCDKLGVDTISFASTLAFAMELKEKNMADFGIDFSNIDNLEEVLIKTSHIEGIYDELANGSRILSEKYGGKDFAMHVKGLEMASYEPRRSVGMGLGYAVANRGGCHLNGGYLALLESVGVLSTDAQSPKSKAELTVFMQDALEAVSAAGCCLFSAQTFIPSIFFKLGPHHPITKLTGKILTHAGGVVKLLLNCTSLLHFNMLILLPHAEALRLATGFSIYTGQFIDIGERSYNLEHMYNVREGWTKSDDTLPKRLTDTPQEENRADTVVPLNEMLPQYYKTRGWDQNGHISKKKLKKLKLL